MVTLRVTGDGCLLAVVFLAPFLLLGAGLAWPAQATRSVEPPANDETPRIQHDKSHYRVQTYTKAYKQLMHRVTNVAGIHE